MTVKVFKPLLFTLLFTGLTSLAIAQRSNMPVIEHHFKALNAHDTVDIARDYAENAKLKSPNWEGEKTGPTDERGIYCRYFVSTPDLVYHITRVIDNHSVMVVEYTSTGTMQHVEDASSQYMVGKKYTLQCVSIFNIENGKITAETAYFDQVAFLRQVGFLSGGRVGVSG